MLARVDTSLCKTTKKPKIHLILQTEKHLCLSSFNSRLKHIILPVMARGHSFTLDYNNTFWVISVNWCKENKSKLALVFDV